MGRGVVVKMLFSYSCFLSKKLLSFEFLHNILHAASCPAVLEGAMLDLRFQLNPVSDSDGSGSDYDSDFSD